MTAWLQPLCRTIVGGLLAMLVLGLWGASPASAADTGPDTAAIDHALPEKDAVRLLVTVPGESEVEMAGVTVTIDGDDVSAETVAAATSDAVERTTILAIDTSAGMRADRLSAAKKAAATYLDSVPANVKVGVLTFDATVKTLVPPVLDREAARKAIAELTLTSQTALYDGLLSAIAEAGPSGQQAGQRKILVLSDGGQDTTDTELSTVLSGIRASGVTVDVVSLQKGDEGNAPLREIATAGEGRVIQAKDTTAMEAAFADEATALTRQVLVTAKLPAGSDTTSSNVLVTVPTAEETFTASAYVPVRRAQDIAAEKANRSRPQAVRSGPLELSTNIMYGAVGAIAIGLLGMVAMLAMGRGKSASNISLSEQIQAYGVMSVPGQTGPRADETSNAFTRPGQAGRREGAGQQQEHGGQDRAEPASPLGSHSSPRSGCCFARPSSWAAVWSACSWLRAASPSACWSSSWPSSDRGST